MGKPKRRPKKAETLQDSGERLTLIETCNKLATFLKIRAGLDARLRHMKALERNDPRKYSKQLIVTAEHELAVFEQGLDLKALGNATDKITKNLAEVFEKMPSLANDLSLEIHFRKINDNDPIRIPTGPQKKAEYISDSRLGITNDTSIVRTVNPIAAESNEWQYPAMASKSLARFYKSNDEKGLSQAKGALRALDLDETVIQRFETDARRNDYAYEGYDWPPADRADLEIGKVVNKSHDTIKTYREWLRGKQAKRTKKGSK